MIDVKNVVSEVTTKNMMNTIEWMVEHVPYRLAGSEMEKKASEFVTGKMKEFGMEVTNETFYSYNSDPMSSKVEILEPEHMVIDSLPCAHIKATSGDGEEYEIVYAGDGSYASYENIDAKGKMVLLEVSYAPPVPEKARIAAEKGAAGIICMNWGNDEEVICNRGLKGVWGNPTEETFKKIPDIIGVGITRLAGLKLKEFCTQGKTVKAKITAIADRKWSLVHQPHGIIRGNGKSDEFILLASHLDAWKPGVTCNATGNATTLEICRILSEHRQELDRDIHVVFWDGHEIAEAAGSTWFLDQNWDQLNKNCIMYMHVDSTGVKDTELLEIKASEELIDFAVRNYKEECDRDLRAMTLKKIGDQSYMGIGVPSVTQRISFTEEAMAKAHGATLGWWNHTKEDGIDKCDPEILTEDTEITLALLYKLATAEMLPYNLVKRIEEAVQKLEKTKEQYGHLLNMDDVMRNACSAKTGISEIYGMRESFSGEQIRHYNEFAKIVCRQLTNVFQTYADKYQQDSYGYSYLSKPIPLLADLERLEAMYDSRDSLEYGMIETQLIKNKNRINDALLTLTEFAKLYKIVLTK